MNYLHWKEETITDFTDDTITKMYNHGFVFTRLGKGVMHQTRSVRINLSKFELNSENKRVLKKTENFSISTETLPLPSIDYDYKLGKLAKDFYDTKFEPGIMSAQKIKELLIDSTKSNFNLLLSYSVNSDPIGYSICYGNNSLLHYSYPFYDLNTSPRDAGLGMMIRAIQYASDAKLNYIYLGSLQRPNDTYKLQFNGLEWFDGTRWQKDIETVKNLLK